MLVTNSTYSWIMLTINHHKTNHKGTSRPCVAISPLMSALSTHSHEQLEQKKRKRREEQGVHRNDQKPKRSQKRVISNEQNLIPKDMGKGLDTTK